MSPSDSRELSTKALTKELKFTILMEIEFDIREKHLVSAGFANFSSSRFPATETY